MAGNVVVEKTGRMLFERTTTMTFGITTNLPDLFERNRGVGVAVSSFVHNAICALANLLDLLILLHAGNLKTRTSVTNQ